MDMSIFRAYDIRGVYGQTLTDDAMEDVGRALGTFMHERGLGRKAVVGNDVRASSPALSLALRSGLKETGIVALNAGTTSFGVAVFTGMQSRCVTAYVTASHNPPEWNGVKFFRADCIGFFENDNKEIGRIAAGGAFRKDSGGERAVDMKKAYEAHLLRKFRPARRLKIALDCGNGSTALVAPGLLKALGFDVAEIFCDVDPRFPGRGPDVTEDSCRHLGEAVRKHGADLGIAFDCDGDRVAAVDEKGKFITSDLLTVAFGRAILKGGRGKIVCNIDCSMLIEGQLEPMGAEVMRIPVGDTFMMQRAKETGALLGAESSQHYVFPSYLPFDDGVVAALKLAEMVSLSDEPASSFFAGLSTLPRRIGSVQCDDGKKAEVMEAVEEAVSGLESSSIDGVRISFEDGWGLIRPSNTSPAIRLTAEGATQKAAEVIYGRISNILGTACKR